MKNIAVGIKAESLILQLWPLCLTCSLEVFLTSAHGGIIACDRNAVSV